jgi:hypothetical protein
VDIDDVNTVGSGTITTVGTVTTIGSSNTVSIKQISLV